MEIYEMMDKDLMRIGWRYVEDGDLLVFDWEVSKLAFIIETHEVVLPEQLKKIDKLHNQRKAGMMKDVLEAINTLAQARDQEDDQ